LDRVERGFLEDEGLDYAIDVRALENAALVQAVRYGFLGTSDVPVGIALAITGGWPR
jgi:hypothetical protein